jgi:hypothetical protein
MNAPGGNVLTLSLVLSAPIFWLIARIHLVPWAPGGSGAAGSGPPRRGGSPRPALGGAVAGAG